MKTIPLILAAAALASSAFAGPTYSGKSTPMMQPPSAPAPGCDCFNSGFAFGLFGGGFLPDYDDADNELGGGFLAEYFFNPYIGLQGTYGVYSTESEHHQFDGSVVLRAPITSLCIAPYVLAGGGFSTNSSNQGTYHVGAGLEGRIFDADCLGIFADGIYYFSEDDDRDFTIVRVGVKWTF